MAENPHPETAKLVEVIDEVRAIMDFADSVHVLDIELRGGHSLSDAVYAFYDIDPVKLEAERRAMLDSFTGGQG